MGQGQLWSIFFHLRSLTQGQQVLVLAQALAERVNMFESSMDGLANGSTFGANLAYGYSLVLLELGSENSEALDT